MNQLVHETERITRHRATSRSLFFTGMEERYK